MASEEDQENQGVKVKDQRRFNPDGSIRSDSTPEAEAAPEVPNPSGGDGKVSGQQEESVASSAEDALPADFLTLVLSLASTAQMGLGIAAHPATGKPEKNLLQARHAIDLLGVLEKKTKGNLSDEEAQLLEAVLGDLRMRFVEVTQKG